MTGLYANAHKATLTLSGFTTGESVALRARSYPVVGDSILDTDSYTTVASECLGKNKPTVKYLSTIKYCYVSTTGNDSTGVASTTQATAAASPVLSIGKAIELDATVIYLKAGNHPCVRNSPGSRRATAEWYVVQPEPGQDRTTVTVSLSSVRQYGCQRLQYQGVTVAITDTSSWLDGQGADNFVRFKDCTFNHGAIGTSLTGPGYQSDACYFDNCLGDLGVSNWSLLDFSTAQVAYTFDGCVMTEATPSAGSIGPWFRVVACATTGSVGWGEHAAANPAPTQDGVLFENNTITAFESTSVSPLIMGSNIQITNGLSIDGNRIEKIAATATEVSISADNSVVICNHILIRNNTGVGERWNLGYNDTGSSATDRRNWFVENNIWETVFTKHDTFGTPNAARIGGWPVLYGVGWNGNSSGTITNLSATGSFMWEFFGLNGYQPSPTTGQPPGVASGLQNPTAFYKFVNRQAWNGTSGTGSGDYRITSLSPAVTTHAEGVPRRRFDADGNYVGAFDPSGYSQKVSPRRGGFF